jgi:hypothetical protein
MTSKTYTANDLYDMFANQADPAAIANTSIEALALDIEEMDTEAGITDYAAAAEEVQYIAWGHVLNRAVMVMDDDIRERLHTALAPCTPQEFMEAYYAAHLATYGEPFSVS